MSPEPTSRTELVPGTLILLVLRVLDSGPLHGYAIAQRIRQVSGEVLRVEEGSLYPALQKMLRKGWVRAEWGLSDTGRRVRSYRLTRRRPHAAGVRTGRLRPCEPCHPGRPEARLKSPRELPSSMMMELLRRISYLWNRRRLEREMAEEMAYHRELMSPDRRTNFGDDLRLREDAREMWGWTWLDRLHQDLTYGARVLRNAPGFTLTAMLVLVLGIGVPLSAFRVVLTDLRGGSVPDPDSLVRLTRRAPGAHMTNLTYPELAFYAANAKSFRNVIGVSQAQSGSLQRGRSRQHARVIPSRSTWRLPPSNYFPEFGIAPALGRVLTPDDERPDAEPAAVIGELFWQRRLGGDPAVIGRSIRVNGKLLRVVGVMPRSARTRDDVWMPLVRQPYVVEGSTLLTDWNSALDLYGRLRPGVSPQASQQETLALAASLREQSARPRLEG